MQVHENEEDQASGLAKEAKHLLSLLHNIDTKNNYKKIYDLNNLIHIMIIGSNHKSGLPSYVSNMGINYQTTSHLNLNILIQISKYGQRYQNIETVGP